MATIRNENKENNLPDLQKHSAITVNQKRAAFGQRNHGNIVPKGKQPLGLKTTNAILKNIEKNSKNLENHAVTTENEQCLKENRKNLVNPIIPVAQFEAFKVYEDQGYEDRLALIEEKLKSKTRHTGLSQVYKAADDTIFSKIELAELERKKRLEEEAAKNVFQQKNESGDISMSSPMKIDQSFDENMQQSEYVLLRGNKSTKDIFFEMEEYRVDIYKYLREHEVRHRPKPGYMKKQPDVTSNMRTILVDWLVEVAEEYKFHTETLFLAVNYIDRFLSYMSVVRAKLQLVGTAAMFLAAKYEEIYPPDVSEFVYITDDTYNKRQVVRMEHLILKVLGFDLSVPTPLTFITATCVCNRLSEKTMYLAMYLSELALLNGDICLEFLPSLIAASAVAIARHTLEEEVWTCLLFESTGYGLKQLRSCIEFLNTMFASAPTFPQHAIQDKYKSQKYMHVSMLKPNESPIEY
ncbi:hypothetical protein JTB14_017729 [Gonioctena quinquepunctata]|nr:hypothetical protein JTB14_017729 [Gonioctena quinquepunctata]